MKMPKFARNGEQNVNKFQIKSKVQILKILNLEFDIYLIFACLAYRLPALPAGRQAAGRAGRDFDI